MPRIETIMVPVKITEMHSCGGELVWDGVVVCGGFSHTCQSCGEEKWLNVQSGRIEYREQEL